MSEADILTASHETRIDPALSFRSIAETIDVDGRFRIGADRLTVDDIRSIAPDLHAVCTSTADEVAGPAMLIIAATPAGPTMRRLPPSRRRRRQRSLNAELDLPDTDVTVPGPQLNSRFRGTRVPRCRRGNACARPRWHRAPSCRVPSRLEPSATKPRDQSRSVVHPDRCCRPGSVEPVPREGGSVPARCRSSRPRVFGVLSTSPTASGRCSAPSTL